MLVKKDHHLGSTTRVSLDILYNRSIYIYIYTFISLYIYIYIANVNLFLRRYKAYIYDKQFETTIHSQKIFYIPIIIYIYILLFHKFKIFFNLFVLRSKLKSISILILRR